MNGFDKYTLQARLFPSGLCFIPFGFLLLVVLPDKFPKLEFWISLCASGAAVMLLSNIGRTLGKSRQPSLVKHWGGLPTTILLRHREALLTEATLLRYHRKLASVLKITLPSATEEAQNPEASDQSYISAVDYLRASTRDPIRFRMVLEENINYGFSRNAWGLKPIAICIDACVLAALLVMPITAKSVLAAIASGAIFLWWILGVTQSSVKTAGFEYARKLLEACDELIPEPAETSKRREA